MSCGLVLASIFLKEEKEKRQQINKQKNVTWSCFSLPLHPTHFEAAVRRMSKIQSVLFLYTFLSSISFFPQVQMETNVWWHIWGTLKRPGKKERAKIEARGKKGKKGRKLVSVCMRLPARRCVPASWRLCRCPRPRLVSHTRAIQRASKRRDFPFFVSNITGPPNGHGCGAEK